MGHTTRILLLTSLALFGCTDASDRTVEALERLQAHTAETVEALCAVRGRLVRLPLWRAEKHAA